MIENKLKIREEHTNQIDEFYETKLGSLEDSIKSMKVAEDLFSNRYLFKFYEYLQHVNLKNEMEKQNLNKLKQNKNELDIEIIKLNSNLIKIREKLSVYSEYRNFMICVKERSIKPPAFFADKSNSQEELKKIASRRLLGIEKLIKSKINDILKNENALIAENDKKNNKSTSKKILSPNQNCKRLSLKNFNNLIPLQNKDSNINNLNDENSRNTAAARNDLNGEFTADLHANIIINNINNLSNKKQNFEIKVSKQDPNYQRIMIENKLEEDNSNLDCFYKEKEEYTRYFKYLTEPIFKTFDDFYSELKKLEKDNITLLNRMNENSTVLFRMKMELYDLKAQDDRHAKKHQNDLLIINAKAIEVRLDNKDLKDKLNKLIIAMSKQTTNLNNKKNKSSSLAKNNLISSSSTSKNFFSCNNENNNNSQLNSQSDRYVVNPLSKTINENFPDNGNRGYYDLESVENARNAKKPGYLNGIISTFNLVNEIIKFEKPEKISFLTYDEQALIMLQHIENNINLLLHRHQNYMQNPQIKNKLVAVTNAIDKQNRAKKSTERMKQVLEDHKIMIERVNYKFNRLNVLPKRKCAPRFRPKDSINSKGVYSSLNFNRNENDDDHDFLDII